MTYHDLDFELSLVHSDIHINTYSTCNAQRDHLFQTSEAVEPVTSHTELRLRLSRYIKIDKYIILVGDGSRGRKMMTNVHDEIEGG